MAQPIEITRIDLNAINLTVLASDARTEGYRFIDRLIREWTDGSNRFDSDGECLYCACAPVGLVGIGGLNRDPYFSGQGIARLRHLYVRPEWRCRGIASLLVCYLLKHASEQGFNTLRLRTDNPVAARLYERLGFVAGTTADQTHFLQLLQRGR